MTKETKAKKEEISKKERSSRMLEGLTSYLLINVALNYLFEPGFSALFYFLVKIIIALASLWFIILIAKELKRKKELKNA